MNSEKTKEIASNAPPAPKYLHSVLQWLETNVRKPLETTVIDEWIFTPAKQYYIAAKRLE
tara:strand:+ start:54 stop:233 length:180 start_codon:yes stop_codon:yes gene_type:complete